MNLPTLITDREFADLLRLSKVNGWRSVQTWARAGKFKGMAIRVGDQWRFREDRVVSWIEKGGMSR